MLVCYLCDLYLAIECMENLNLMYLVNECTWQCLSHGIYVVGVVCEGIYVVCVLTYILLICIVKQVMNFNKY